MSGYTFTLSATMSVNHMWANGGMGVGRTRTERYNRWRWQSMAEMSAQGPRAQFGQGPVTVTVQISRAYLAGRFTGKKVFDIDNANKAILDLLVNMGVIDDDTWRIVTTVAVRVADIAGPVLVSVTEGEG